MLTSENEPGTSEDAKTSLRERHNLNHKTTETTLTRGDVVLIKGEERGKWKICIVEQLIQGRDGVVRGARLRAGKSYLERPLQLLYPLELTCDRPVEGRGEILNANAREFQPRRAATDARQRIAVIAQDELDEN